MMRNVKWPMGFQATTSETVPYMTRRGLGRGPSMGDSRSGHICILDCSPDYHHYLVREEEVHLRGSRGDAHLVAKQLLHTAPLGYADGPCCLLVVWSRGKFYVIEPRRFDK